MSKPFLITTVSLLSRILLSSQSSFQVLGAHHLLDLLTKDRNRPLITVSNHCSVIDDPVLFAGILPFKILLNEDILRKGFGAREICFTNPIYSWFFGNGGIIPVDRGKGIFQPAMAHALQILNSNGWFHIFSEGKVNQTPSLIPFRWGVGRLILESKVPPLVVCFYHSGLDQVMPETYRFVRVPRINKRIICQFGTAIDSYDLIKSSNHMDIDAQRAFITDSIFKLTDKLRLLSLNNF